jgi:hypothetical protein
VTSHDAALAAGRRALAEAGIASAALDARLLLAAAAGAVVSPASRLRASSARESSGACR